MALDGATFGNQKNKFCCLGYLSYHPFPAIRDDTSKVP